MKRIACLVFALLFTFPAMAQESGLSFLRIGVNASAGAMGDGEVASSRGAYATYWNPAGLAGQMSNSLAFSHHIWIANTRTYSLASRFQVGESSGVGLFVTALDSGDLEARDGPGAADGFFSAQFVSTGASYGVSVGPARLGITAKYLAQRIFTNSADGYAFDFGIQASFAGDALHLGAALQNVGEMSVLSAEATELPRTVRGGLTIFPFRVVSSLDGTLLVNASLTAEISHSIPDDITRIHAGLSVEVVEMVIARAGYITNDALRGLTVGGGLGTSSLMFDYAFIPFDVGFGRSGHVLSLVYDW